MKQRIRIAMVATLVAIVTACAPTPDSTDTPWCDDFGVLMLEAQSIPSAQLLPCFEQMSRGWSPGSTHIDEHGTTFTMDSTTAGDDAARIRLLNQCSTRGYVQVPSDEPGTARFELVTRISDGYAGSRLYLYPGGCTSIDFSFDAGVSASLVNEVSFALGFVPRGSVNQVVRDITDGREQLDPVADG